MPPHPGKILALDYGTIFIGAAVCDESQQLVFGRGVMEEKKGKTSRLEQIVNLCKTESVVKIVFGLPLNMEGQETYQTRQIRAFAEKLQTYLPNIPIDFTDEAFTSFEADQFLATLPPKTSKKYGHKALQDEMAAVLILKRYLKLPS